MTFGLTQQNQKVQDLAGNCSNHKCDLNSKCNLMNKSCEVSDCGREQEIGNSTLLYHGHHEVGNGVIYGCKEPHDMRNINGDAIPSGQGVVSCNGEGKWEAPHFECYDACPSSWIPYNGHHYCFATKTATWMDARERCIKRNSHLVKLDSADEFTWINNEMTRPTITWLGGNDRDKEGHWIWESDSSPLHDKFLQQLWEQGEPNNAYGHEHCLQYNNWRLNDVSCNLQRNYICKR